MKNIKANIVLQILYQILMIIVPLLTTPIISRAFGAEGLGEYTFSITIVQYFGLFAMLGISNFGTREIAACLDDKEKRSRTFWNIFLLQFICSITVTLIYLLTIFLLPNYNRKLGLFVGVYLLSCMVDISWLFFGLEKFSVTVIKNSFIKIFSLILIFVFVHSYDDIYIYVLISVGSQFLSNLFLWINTRKNISIIKPSFKMAFKYFKPNLILFIPVIAASLFVYGDKIVIGLMSTKTELGFYEAMEKMVNMPYAFIAAVGNVMFSKSVHLINSNRIEENRIVFNYTLRIMLWFTIAVLFGFISVSNFIIPIYYGDGFEDVEILLQLSGLFLLFRGIRSVIKTQILLPFHHDKVFVITMLISGLINIFLNLILVYFYGALGAVISTIISDCISTLYCIIYIKKYIEFKKIFLDFFYFIFSGLIMFMSIKLFNNFELFINEYVYLILVILLGGLVYLFATIPYLFFILKKRKVKYNV